MGGYKKGENEAKKILESKGFKFNESYHDDNSIDSMPDLQFENGIFLEVTHTSHNIQLSKKNNFMKKTLYDRCSILDEVNHAYYRFLSDYYEKDENGDYTSKGEAERRIDINKIEKHYGFNLETKEHSEFKCDCPTIIINSKNIIDEICADKGEKYKDRNDVELFIFLTEDEYKYLENEQTIDAEKIKKAVESSTFNSVFFCEWDFFNNRYNVSNPKITRILKTPSGLTFSKL